MKEKMRELLKRLSEGFVGREEEARVAVLALLTKQHAVFIGEPGTAKSALIHRLSKLVNCKYFYYLLNRFTVPDELVGAVDPVAYKQGQFKRNVSGRLPEAEVAFVDEVFKGSSETLNALLSVMNERVFVDVDGTVYRCPLWSLFGASNETPTDSELQAFYDRFLLKHFVRRIDTSRVEEAIIYMVRGCGSVSPVCSLKEVKVAYEEVSGFMANNITSIAREVAKIVSVFRSKGLFVSDRTAISPDHLPRLVAAYCWLFDVTPNKAVIHVSKYLVPSEEYLKSYEEALEEIMPPELREAYRELEMARDYATQVMVKDAKAHALKALQMAEALSEKHGELFKEEIKEIIDGAEDVVKRITKIEEELKTIKKR